MLLFGATKGFVSLMFSYFVGMESTLIIRANTLSIGVTGYHFMRSEKYFPFSLPNADQLIPPPAYVRSRLLPLASV